MRWTFLALVLSGCGVRTSCYVDGAFDSIMSWSREPTVGVQDGSEQLAVPVRLALEEWGWGVYVGDCNNVDICLVRKDRRLGDPLGTALRNRGSLSCEIIMYTDSKATTAHELGHCYGLEHRDDGESIMVPSGMWDREVTDDDRDTLFEINSQCLGINP